MKPCIHFIRDNKLCDYALTLNTGRLQKFTNKLMQTVLKPKKKTTLYIFYMYLADIIMYVYWPHFAHKLDLSITGV